MPVALRGGRTGPERADVYAELRKAGGAGKPLARAALHRLVERWRIAGGGVERDFIDVKLGHCLTSPPLEGRGRLRNHPRTTDGGARRAGAGPVWIAASAILVVSPSRVDRAYRSVKCCKKCAADTTQLGSRLRLRHQYAANFNRLICKSQLCSQELRRHGSCEHDCSVPR